MTSSSQFIIFLFQFTLNTRAVDMPYDVRSKTLRFNAAIFRDPFPMCINLPYILFIATKPIYKSCMFDPVSLYHILTWLFTNFFLTDF